VPGAAWAPITPLTCYAAYRPGDAAAKTLRALAMDLISEERQLECRIAKAANDIQTSFILGSATG
jgi:transposase